MHLRGVLSGKLKTTILKKTIFLFSELASPKCGILLLQHTTHTWLLRVPLLKVVREKETTGTLSLLARVFACL